MTNEQLQKLVEEISLVYFNKAFKHCATWCSRLRSTGGRYHLKTHHLDFNPRVLKELGEDALIGVIKHELCHYHLHLLNLGYRHRDKDFKELLRLVQGSRYVVWETESVNVGHKYRCRGCHQEIIRQRRFNVSRFVCAKCRSHYEKIE